MAAYAGSVVPVLQPSGGTKGAFSKAGTVVLVLQPSSGAKGAFSKTGMAVPFNQPGSGAKGAFSKKAGTPHLGPPGGPILNYTMRGYDTDLSKYVFWLASEPDGDASEYGGNPAAVIDIIIFRIEI